MSRILNQPKESTEILLGVVYEEIRQQEKTSWSMLSTEMYKVLVKTGTPLGEFVVANMYMLKFDVSQNAILRHTASAVAVASRMACAYPQNLLSFILSFSQTLFQFTVLLSPIPAWLSSGSIRLSRNSSTTTDR